MSKDNNSKWNFVEMPANVPSRSGEDSTFDHFRSKPYRFIVREFIQNSMDVPVDATYATPVKVEIGTGAINTSEYDQLIGSLKERMQACKERCDENENSRNPYTKKVAYLEDIKGKDMPYLVISDYNTTGMEYTNDKQCGFNAGVRQMGASHKGTGNAGGSHGLGKVVGFVASEINTVYYSTMTAADNSTYGEGVTRLCAHSVRGTEFFPDAFYDSHEGNHPDYALDIPEDFRRIDAGTSVYILGIQPNDEDIVTMKQEVLRSFWMAIHHKKLIVQIDDDVFMAETLSDLMNKYLPDPTYGMYDVKSYRLLVEKFNPKPYYFNCIVDSENADESHHVFEASSSKYPVLEHARLYVYKNESIKNYTEDRIVCMRDKEMVIEFYRPGTHKGYYAVLVCDGEGSKYLRKMENVTHDKWDKNEVKDLDSATKENSNAVLKEIKRFIEKSIESIFLVTDDTEYKVPVLSKYIVAAGNRTQSDRGTSTSDSQDSSDNPQSPISTISDGITRKRVQAKKVGRVVIRKKGGAKKKKLATPVDDGLGTITQPIEAPVTTPPTPLTPTPNPPVPPVDPPTPPEDDPNKVPPTPNNPTSGEVGHETANRGRHARTKSGKHAEDIIAEFRVIPQPSDVGLVHRIIINSDDDYKSCSMAITIAGEDKDTTLRFEPINKSYRVIGKEMNILSDFDLIKGKNYIDVKFEDNDYHSLNIKAYEN